MYTEQVEKYQIVYKVLKRGFIAVSKADEVRDVQKEKRDFVRLFLRVGCENQNHTKVLQKSSNFD